MSKQSQIGLFGTRRRGESRGVEEGRRGEKTHGEGSSLEPPLPTAVRVVGRGRPRGRGATATAVGSSPPGRSYGSGRRPPTAGSATGDHADGRGRPRGRGASPWGRPRPSPRSGGPSAWTASADPADGRPGGTLGRPRARPFRPRDGGSPPHRRSSGRGRTTGRDRAPQRARPVPRRTTYGLRFSIGRDPTAVGAPPIDLSGRLGIRATIKGWPCICFIHLGARATCAGFTSAQLRSSKLFPLPHGVSWDCFHGYQHGLLVIMKPTN